MPSHGRRTTKPCQDSRSRRSACSHSSAVSIRRNSQSTDAPVTLPWASMLGSVPADRTSRLAAASTAAKAVSRQQSGQPPCPRGHAGARPGRDCGEPKAAAKRGPSRDECGRCKTAVAVSWGVGVLLAPRADAGETEEKHRQHPPARRLNLGPTTATIEMANSHPVRSLSSCYSPFSGWEWISGLGDRSRYRTNPIPIAPKAMSMIMSNTHQPE